MKNSVEKVEVIHGCLWEIQQIKGPGELLDIHPFMCSHDINLS